MERDDIIEYSLDVTHSEEAGVKIRKNIYKVTAILSIVTTIEVLLGVFWSSWGMPWAAVKWAFIVMTLFKAAYIVMVFMHLGDEKKALKWVILAPYVLFIMYLIFICLMESSYIFTLRQAFGF